MSTLTIAIVIAFVIGYACIAMEAVTKVNKAAGVVVMGLEKISFGWYMKKTTPAAFAGYIAGIAIYWIQATFFFRIWP